MPRARNRIVVSLVMLSILIPIGLCVRFANLPLPWFLWKYLGSMLWAAALYWFVAALLQRSRPAVIAAFAALAAILTEISRLLPQRHVDAFRQTLAGKVLLGRYFAWTNILAYVIAIALTALLDETFLKRRYLKSRAG